MNHPTREQWMSFLYEDIDATEKNKLTEHLDSCDACRRQIAGWRGTMSTLNQWNLAAPAPRRAAQPWLRWAAAAALLLTLGISIGAATRAGAPGSDRAEIQKLRQEIQSIAAAAQSQRETLELLTRTIAENRAQDQQAVLVTLREMETRRQSDLRNIRKDLETVAVTTEESLDHTQNQLVRLAGYTTGQ
jgi:hypothetical protein